jgi:hypothetical protein
MRQSQPSELGQVISRHNGRVFSVGWLMSMGLIFAGYVVTWGITNDDTLRTAAGVCAVAVAVFISWRRWDQGATVYEGGVVWRRGRRTQTVRWEDVADVAAETFNDEYELRVTTNDGRELVFNDSVANVRQLHAYFVNATRYQGRAVPSSSSSSLRL